MFGRRRNLLFLLKLLKRKNIENATWTEFCQGHTKRWGLAWSFLSKDVIDLTSAPVIRKSGDYIAKLLREQHPAEIQFPMRHRFSSLDHVVQFLEDAMGELHVRIKEISLPIDDFNGWSCQLIAKDDTWSHARRKRRLIQRLMNRSTENETECAADDKIDDARNNSIEEEEVQTSMDEQSIKEQALLICNFFIEVVENEESEDDEVKISMVFENGTGGKNALETFRQYLINKLGVREYFQKRQAKPNKKKRKRLKISDNERKESFANDDVESA